MNRRGFLSFLGAAVAGATLDPERLLWVPGAKLISISKPRITPQQIDAIRPILDQLAYKHWVRLHDQYFAAKLQTVGYGFVSLMNPNGDIEKVSIGS